MQGGSFLSFISMVLEIPYTNTNNNFLALGEVVGKETFQSYMQRVFEDANFGEQWDEKKWKSGYSKWMEDKLIDVLYNTWSILENYRKLQDMPMDQEEAFAF